MRKISFLLIHSIAFLSYVLASTEYKVISKEVGSSSVKLGLSYTGKDNYYIKEKSVIPKELVFLLKCHSFLDFTFKIYDPTH